MTELDVVELCSITDPVRYCIVYLRRDSMEERRKVLSVQGTIPIMMRDCRSVLILVLILILL